ncbi:uncharacterized protein LOC131237567 isoform X2 [Magnolia sinica]|uniref:uncharacterized protein LOC131237567 isoform X2 n=1 Tax=Magnolia sinica TaxID=86752 RepID=UPI0026599B5B|nr:uncharacterized protein LOC131237567 isoform X2 [Magnolia sinica]
MMGPTELADVSHLFPTFHLTSPKPTLCFSLPLIRSPLRLSLSQCQPYRSLPPLSLPVDLSTNIEVLKQLQGRALLLLHFNENFVVLSLIFEVRMGCEPNIANAFWRRSQIIRILKAK